MTSATRRDELARNLTAVRERVARACDAVGSDPGEVHLIVVTKHFPASDVLTLHELGVRDIGENRDQEAAGKVGEVRAALREHSSGVADALTVHFIGQLQSNKAGRVAGYADAVHSLDRAKVIDALARGAESADRVLDGLVQVSLDGDTSRGGARREEVSELADRIAAHHRLRLRGVMAVAPVGADPALCFADLRDIADGIRASHPEAGWISAGMSADLEPAVAAGATHLRVGTAILGSRAPLL
ncbi:YggS family pyridoxal phosphate enzyme [Humibacillus sp. DSM 29435]|uniref:YggS family pyridoxal phosphate-dependent enzyme n=1 Tax=Humibacillus sp. DSM 29435 TaxID=1869167 RepID=UPI0008728F9B|nr:YggS family pyridoxal phosphate-dependent enzyme [Humibacillus sp. DSM 29435]OFE17468.1 YggS family pyridoxal phosphate enzyme [Humibacillus sp. DSM 29435]